MDGSVHVEPGDGDGKHSALEPHGMVQRLDVSPTVLHKPPCPFPQATSAVQDLDAMRSKTASQVVAFWLMPQ